MTGKSGREQSGRKQLSRAALHIVYKGGLSIAPIELDIRKGKMDVRGIIPISRKQIELLSRNMPLSEEVQICYLDDSCSLGDLFLGISLNEGGYSKEGRFLTWK